MAQVSKKKEGTEKKPLLLNEVRVEKLKLTARSLTDITYQIFKNPMGALGVAILVVFVMLAAVGPMIAPYDTSNLGLGKWQLPSTFETDPPKIVPLLVPATTLIAGLATAVLALYASFARRPEWDKPNKLLQIGAIGLSAGMLSLLMADYAFGSFDGPYPVPSWVYPVSVLAPSLVMLSLATRRRVSKRRFRLRVVGVVLALAPVAVMSIPAIISLEEGTEGTFFLAGYGISAFLLALSGACFSSAYKKPQIALLKYEKRTGKKRLLPVRVSAIAKASAITLCCVLMVSGVLGYLSENWTLHWMGTDSFGADIFSKLLYGARTSMIVGVFSAIIASVLGAMVGLYSGYVGGRVDEVIMRANDVVLSIPWLVLMIIVAAMMGEITLTGIILIIGLTGWSPTARMVRAQVLSIRERQYIERARAIGASDLGIIRRHVLPNSFPLVFANTILTVAVSILSESVLSFLGMRPVGTTTWGTMLDYASSANAFSIGLHWWIIAPGMCIVLVVLGFTLLGYALDDILNPKLRKR